MKRSGPPLQNEWSQRIKQPDRLNALPQIRNQPRHNLQGQRNDQSHLENSPTQFENTWTNRQSFSSNLAASLSPGSAYYLGTSTSDSFDGLRDRRARSNFTPTSSREEDGDGNIVDHGMLAEQQSPALKGVGSIDCTSEPTNLSQRALLILCRLFLASGSGLRLPEPLR